MTNQNPTDNDKRADWGLIAMEAFAASAYGLPADRDMNDQDAFEQALSDLIADLIHACDRVPNVAGEPGTAIWARCMDRGYGHYHEEWREEHEPPPLRAVSP